MTWHTVVAAADEFQRLLGAIRTAGWAPEELEHTTLARLREGSQSR